MDARCIFVAIFRAVGWAPEPLVSGVAARWRAGSRAQRRAHGRHLFSLSPCSGRGLEPPGGNGPITGIKLTYLNFTGIIRGTVPPFPRPQRPDWLPVAAAAAHRRRPINNNNDKSQRRSCMEAKKKIK